MKIIRGRRPRRTGMCELTCPRLRHTQRWDGREQSVQQESPNGQSLPRPDISRTHTRQCQIQNTEGTRTLPKERPTVLPIFLTKTDDSVGKLAEFIALPNLA